MENYDKIRDEYKPDILSDDETLYKVKKALETLTPAEQRIYITYLELKTYKATAREYNCSAPTLKKKINTITDKIIRYVDNTD